MAEQDIPPPTITAMKIPIIRKGEYDIWSMRMRQYICHTDHNLWDVIVNGDLEEEPAPTGETSAPPAPKTAKQLAAKRNQERVKSILLLAIPDEYLLKFHNVADAKSLWEAIKSRFGGNEESKKMQKNVLKHQFENFSTASNESLDKAYDRFQKLISQLEVHGAPISKEDINQKFLRSLPPSWNQIALIMRNKPDIDEIDIDDLYNNLRVYEDEMKRSSSSTSTSQNLAFLSSENTSSTNEVSTASGDFGVSTAGGISQVSSTPCAHDVACSFFAQPTTSPQLENEDFQQIDEDDLEELDLRWQVAMLTVRVRKFIQKTGRNMDFKEKKMTSFHLINRKNCVLQHHRKGNFARNADLEGIKEKILCDNVRIAMHQQMNLITSTVAQDGLGGYNWSNDFEIEPVNYALMAISSSIVNTGKGKMDNAPKKSRWVWRPKGNYIDHESKEKGSFIFKKFEYVDPKGTSKSVVTWVPKRYQFLLLIMQGNLESIIQDHAVVDSSCSSHMTSNKAYLSDYKDYNGGFVAFGSEPKGGKITGKGKIRTANLDFDDVYFVDELTFNLFSVSQMCDKKNSVLFTDTECLILSPSFKLLDKSQVVLRAPR
ncbi:hypothetical protein Tco_0806432 [Tanacetum coccineum]